MKYRDILREKYAGKSKVFVAYATGSRTAPDMLISQIIAAAFGDDPDAVKLARIRNALRDSWTGAAEYASSFDVEVN